MTDPLDLDRHGAALRRAARALARDVHAADDLVQDTWVAALEHGAWGEVRARFAWLATVLRRRAAGLRAHERFEPLEHAEALVDERGARDAAGEHVSGGWSEAAVRLTSAVHRLPAAESPARVADGPAPLGRAAEQPSVQALDERGGALAVAPRPSDRAEATLDAPAVELPAALASPNVDDTKTHGQLRVEVVDGATHEATENYLLKLELEPEPGDTAAPIVVDGINLGATKFPPGQYSGAVYRAGRDPHTLGTFTIAPQVVTDLGRVVLQPGGGTLEVEVVAAQGASFSLELFGAGRRRGPCCAEFGAGRCETCGHRTDRSEGEVAAGSSFRFERLAAGPYDLVVRDTAQRIVASREVVLAPDETRWLEVTLDRKDVEVWLTDVDGAPFDGVWFEEGEEFCAPLRFHGWSGEVLAASGDVSPVEAGVRLPRADPEGPVVPPAPRARDEGDQRPPFHAVWPPSLAQRPLVLQSEARAERIAPGRYRLIGVPLELDGVQVGCGPFITARAAVVPEPGYADTARLRVVTRCMIRSRDVVASPTLTCTTCHVVQEAKR